MWPDFFWYQPLYLPFLVPPGTQFFPETESIFKITTFGFFKNYIPQLQGTLIQFKNVLNHGNTFLRFVDNEGDNLEKDSTHLYSLLLICLFRNK